MTRPTLLIGTSHIAALRLAWSRMETPPDFDFFGYPVHATELMGTLPDGTFGLRSLKGSRQKGLDEIVAINGRQSVDLRLYRNVVQVGHFPGYGQILRLVAATGLAGLRRPPSANSALLTRATFRGFVRGISAEQWPTDLLEGLGPRCKAIVLMPLRSELSVERDDEQGQTAQALRANPEGMPEIMGLLFHILCEYYAERGIALLHQPLDTLGPFGLTDARFSRGAVNLKTLGGLAGQEEDRAARGRIDMAHMNADYGQIMIGKVVDWLNQQA